MGVCLYKIYIFIPLCRVCTFIAYLVPEFEDSIFPVQPPPHTQFSPHNSSGFGKWHRHLVDLDGYHNFSFMFDHILLVFHIEILFFNIRGFFQ